MLNIKNGARYENAPLTVKVAQGRLIIEVGVKTLAWAYDNRDDHDSEPVTIIDHEEFAQDVAHALLKEREDGWTPVCGLLDDACDAAISDGSLGVLFPEDDF